VFSYIQSERERVQATSCASAVTERREIAVGAAIPAAGANSELKEAIRSVEAGGGEPDTPPTTPQRELLGVIRSAEEAANGEPAAPGAETPTATSRNKQHRAINDDRYRF
jgi:hypothetical protein